MKKNIIATILSATLIASLALTGCGNTSDVDSTETVVESTEEAVAVEEDATEEEFVEDETLSEESTEEVESTEVEENETESETEIKSENESESETEIKSESADATASEPAGYTYTDMSTTMYAKSTVTVRDLPSTDGKKLGSLSTNQGVAVTGQCNETGWYRIEYNGSTGYVSNKYLSDEQATAQNTTNGDTGNGASGSTAGTDTGTTNAGSTSTSTVADGFYKDIAQQIWAKVNAERAAAGENAIAWNEEIYSFACQRAQAIVNDYSHNGCGNYAENIYWGYGAPSADYIHQGWHDSPGHYANYMRQSSGVGACAVYVVNGNWYAVENFSMTAPGETITSDEAIERGLVSQSDNYTPSGTPYTASNGVTIYVEQNGTQMEYTAEAGTDMDAMLAAINEYEASIDSQ
jgi:uncharacterized protein YkwD